MRWDIGGLEPAVCVSYGVAMAEMMEGVPMPIIQQQLGHASLATTDRYLSHIAPKIVIETMGRREWSP